MIADEANQIAFKVAKDATRPEIKEAVETIYGVNVLNVTVLNVKGKVKRNMRGISKKPSWKKAYVRLAAGQDIDFAAVPKGRREENMPVVKAKPTSPGRRFVVKVVNPDLHKGEPYKPLLEKKSKTGGRNNNGRITTRHIGGGHKQKYRDYRLQAPNKDGIKANRESLEYDPNRTANIALLKVRRW